MVYLDYNASVPLRPQAKDAMVQAFALHGNPSSPHQVGRTARALVEKSRKTILRAVQGEKLIFTSGGTEANALALTGLGDLPVVVSAIEHDSVLKAAPHRTLAPVSKDGVIDLKQLEEVLDTHHTPGLLSVMLVNNETGVIQPIKEIAEMARVKGWKMHTDASQAPGNIPLSFSTLGVDMMTLSAHKCGGPIGIGALILKEDLHLEPLIRGGGQEFGMRAGTLSAPLTAGFAEALEVAMAEEPTASANLRTLQKEVESALPQATFYGKESPRSPQVLAIGMPRVSAELQLMAFDLKGIAISAGSACSSGKMKSSHVLSAMAVSEEEAKCAIRMSMGWKTTPSDIQSFIQAWHDIFSEKHQKEALSC